MAHQRAIKVRKSFSLSKLYLKCQCFTNTKSTRKHRCVLFLSKQSSTDCRSKGPSAGVRLSLSFQTKLLICRKVRCISFYEIISNTETKFAKKIEFLPHSCVAFGEALQCLRCSLPVSPCRVCSLLTLCLHAFDASPNPPQSML